MSGLAVRRAFVKNFGKLERNSRRQATLIVANYAAQIVVLIGLGYWLLQSGSGGWMIAGLALTMFLTATRLRGLNNIIHECSHATFTEKREDNVYLGSICAAIVMSSYHDYRDEHMTHHMHLGDYEKDMDLQGIRDLRIEDPLTPRTILRHLFTPLLGLHLPYYLGANLSDRDGRGFQVLKYALIAAATLFLILDPVAALVLVWVPFVWMYSAINYWTDCADHGGLLEHGDELDASRNIPLPAFLRVIIFPRNDCYHLIHHLFPQVPVQHFHDCHEDLMAHPAYKSRIMEPEKHGQMAEV